MRIRADAIMVGDRITDCGATATVIEIRRVGAWINGVYAFDLDDGHTATFYEADGVHVESP